MIPIRRVAMGAVVLTAALGLSACNDETVTSPPSGEATSSPSAPDAQHSAPEDGGDTTTDQSEAPAPTENSQGDDDSSSDESATKGTIKDKNAIPVQRAGLPEGPVTDIGVKLLGGYPSSDEYGKFYAVLDVTSSEPGLIKLQYVMLDDSGKELKTVDDSIAVSGTAHELKVTRASGELPTADKGKVAKVRLKVVENKANSFATVTQIKPKSVKIGHDSSTNTPTVSGEYRTSGKGSVISMNAVCADKDGVVRTDSSPVPKIKAPSWTPFTVKLLTVERGYNPTTCFVGS